MECLIIYLYSPLALRSSCLVKCQAKLIVDLIHWHNHFHSRNLFKTSCGRENIEYVHNNITKKKKKTTFGLCRRDDPPLPMQRSSLNRPLICVFRHLVCPPRKKSQTIAIDLSLSKGMSSRIRWLQLEVTYKTVERYLV